jgi:hypothetical protein
MFLMKINLHIIMNLNGQKHKTNYVYLHPKGYKDILYIIVLRNVK